MTEKEKSSSLYILQLYQINSSQRYFKIYNFGYTFWGSCMHPLPCTFLCDNCCSVAQLCLTLCNPMDCSTLGFPVCKMAYHLLELAQTHVH